MPAAQPDMVVVTNVAALEEKYGDRAGEVVEAVAAYCEAGQTRGATARLVDLSDRTTMRRFRVAPVSVADEAATKAAIDAVHRSLQPDYLTILGGPDVVAHQQLPNPLHDTDDVDVTVPSDLPYATEAPHGGDISDYLSVTRVVGRIPDLPGTSDPTGLLEVLAVATDRPAAVDDKVFSLSAKVWVQSTRLSVAEVGGDPAQVRTAPPAGQRWTKVALRPGLHFINCHGGSAYPAFVGEPGMDDCLRATQVAGKVMPGAVIAAECCYGAELYDPELSDGQAGVAMTYLTEGAAGFFGSTTIAYGPADSMDKADILCAQFLRRVRGGASTGRACAEARQHYIRETPVMGPTDLKTIAQFLLLGDPSAAPLEQRARPGRGGGGKAVGRRSFAIVDDGPARKERRRNLVSNGFDLAATTSCAVERSATKKAGGAPAAAARRAEDVAKRHGLTGRVALVFDVAERSPAKAFTAAPAPLRWFIVAPTKPTPKSRAIRSVPRIAFLDVLMRGDEVVSAVRLESR